MKAFNAEQKHKYNFQSNEIPTLHNAVGHPIRTRKRSRRREKPRDAHSVPVRQFRAENRSGFDVMALPWNDGVNQKSPPTTATTTTRKVASCATIQNGRRTTPPSAPASCVNVIKDLSPPSAGGVWCGICVNGSGLLFRSVAGVSGATNCTLFCANTHTQPNSHSLSQKSECQKRNKIAPLTTSGSWSVPRDRTPKGQKLNEKCEKLILARDNLWPFGSGNDLPFIRLAYTECVYGGKVSRTKGKSSNI